MKDCCDVVRGDYVERLLVALPRDVRGQVMRVVGRLHDQCAWADHVFQHGDRAVALLAGRAIRNRNRYDFRHRKKMAQERKQRLYAVLVGKQFEIVEQIVSREQRRARRAIVLLRAKDGLDAAPGGRHRAPAAAEWSGETMMMRS